MQSQLFELCSQFEEVLVTSLVNKTTPSPAAFGMGEPGPDELAQPSSDLPQMLFSQAFAAAIERCGGLGLNREIYHSLTQVPT